MKLMNTVDMTRHKTQTSTPIFQEKFWILLAFLTISTITIAAVFWIFAHPYSTNWDEAKYFDRVYKDATAFEKGGIFELIRVLFQEERSKPPAYRIFILPFTLVFGVSPSLLRIVSLMFFFVTCFFTYLTSKRIAGATAGGFAVAILVICPTLIGETMRFYVDYILYFAIASTLYFLFLNWNRLHTVSHSWIGLGISLGLGGLAKPTFVFVIAPMILLTMILSWRKMIIEPSPKFLLKASGLAVILMLPWWGFNFKPALRQVISAGHFIRHSLGQKGSAETLGKWLYVFSQSLLGLPLALLILAILITFLLKLKRKRINLDVTTSTALVVCLAGVLPMLIIAGFGTNHNIRLVAPTLFPIVIAFGIMAAKSRWTTSRVFLTIATIIICFQLTLIISSSTDQERYYSGEGTDQTLLWGYPTTVMHLAQQWDWSKLRKLCQDYQIIEPKIAYLGNTGTFNIPQISYPWVKAKEEITVSWLWRYEDNTIDWEKVMNSIESSNVVLTIPGLVGNLPDKQDIDNQHNAELVQRLQNIPEFQEPIVLQINPSSFEKVFVFFRKTGKSESIN